MALATDNGNFEDEFPAELEFNSPSVGILSQRFPGDGKCRILDLGAPCESNVAFFADGSSRIYVEDLFRYFIAPREEPQVSGVDEEQGVAGALAEALEFEDSARLDLVLGWDLFSYMERGTVELLMRRIARSCRAGALLFLTLPTDAMIPSVPARICMTRQGHLHYRKPIQSRSIPNPRLSPTALQTMMPGFRLLHSYLLGGRMQEFLFSFA